MTEKRVRFTGDYPLEGMLHWPDDDALQRFVTCVAPGRQLLMSSAHGEVVERLTAPAHTVWLRDGRAKGAETTHE